MTEWSLSTPHSVTEIFSDDDDCDAVKTADWGSLWRLPLPYDLSSVLCLLPRVWPGNRSRVPHSLQVPPPPPALPPPILRFPWAQRTYGEELLRPKSGSPRRGTSQPLRRPTTLRCQSHQTRKSATQRLIFHTIIPTGTKATLTHFQWIQLQLLMI